MMDPSFVARAIANDLRPENMPSYPRYFQYGVSSRRGCVEIVAMRDTDASGQCQCTVQCLAWLFRSNHSMNVEVSKGSSSHLRVFS